MARGKKTVWTEAQKRKIAEAALRGLSTNQIAALIDKPVESVRDNFAKFIHKKRSERAFKLGKRQNEIRDNDNSRAGAAMAIFQGKQRESRGGLEQVDRAPDEGRGGPSIRLFLDLRRDQSDRRLVVSTEKEPEPVPQLQAGKDAEQGS